MALSPRANGLDLRGGVAAWLVDHVKAEAHGIYCGWLVLSYSSKPGPVFIHGCCSLLGTVGSCKQRCTAAVVGDSTHIR